MPDETAAPTTTRDIVLTQENDIGHSAGPAARFDANLAAVRTLKKIEAENRSATPEEQMTMAKFSGWGDSGFNNAFDSYVRRYKPDAMSRRGEELEKMLTEDEYQAIENSRRTAYFTTPDIVRATWDAMTRLGANKLTNPRVLEPSAGSGRFLSYQPPEMAAKSQRIAVELDSLTGRMLKHTFPQTEVYAGVGYQNAPIPKESIDIAISNVPFSKVGVTDTSFPKGKKFLTRSLHNYFFAKALEQLRPGGMIGFITSHQTLDAPTSKDVRQELSEKADLISAIRLPKDAFPDTEVVTDLIFMRKRLPTEPKGDTSWVETQSVTLPTKPHYANKGQGRGWGEVSEEEFDVNKYFIQHPENVLGTPSGMGSMRTGAGEYTVERETNVPLSFDLQTAVRNMPRDVITDAPAYDRRAAPMATPATAHEGSYIVASDGTLHAVKNGTPVKVNLDSYDDHRVRQMLALRDVARKVVDIQVKDGLMKELVPALDQLNTLYDNYVTKYGALNNKHNSDLMKYDPDGAFLRALEESPDNKKEEGEKRIKALYKAGVLEPAEAKELKMPVFTGRVINGTAEKTSADTESDSLAIVLNETGKLDFERMGTLLGKTANEVKAKLATQKLIYKNPTGDWEPADQYLSGDVRQKLRDAETAASANESYKGNVTALKAIQPEDLSPSQISVKLGSSWVPPEYINGFIRQLLYSYVGYRQTKKTNFVHWADNPGEWVFDNPIGGDKSMRPDEVKLTSIYGTERMPANKIIQNVLLDKPCDVFDGDGDDKVRNPKESIAAQEKASLVKKAFVDWLWNDTERAKKLAEIYNNRFNTHRNRNFDGSHLTLPGINQKWAKWMETHQRDAIWRTIQDRTALMAHEVGFGKTAVMVTAGMELRRLGLSQKNLYVVPKATHKQFKNDFMDIYPYAKVLFPQEDDFTKEKRPEFEARAITGDWDAIILSYEQFAKIPTKPETQAKFIREEIDAYRDALEQAVMDNPDDKKSHKQIQDALAALEKKLTDTQANLKEKQENTVHFEDIGVDQLFVDEADNFKNLAFATKKSRIKGLPNSKSDRAWDMYSKVRTLQQQNKNGGVVFATGTPVANTIAEMYTMMRYLQPKLLEEKKLQSFDAWASNFGEMTDDIEQTVTGKYKQTRRFAKFVNMPELSKLWQQTSDIRVADEVPAIARKRPHLIDENGKEKRTVISVPPSERLLAYMGELQTRADELPNTDPKDDNMLKISSDARKASLDMRMVDPNAPDDPMGKIPVASKKIAQVYNETTKDKGAQLVFLDLGTPKAKEEEAKKKVVKDETGQWTEEEVQDEDETTEEKAVLQNVYAKLRQELIAQGIPEKEIAYIHEAKNDKQKAALMAKTNDGDIRVVIGSTGKLGVGVNVQKRAAALHHLDCPWRPRDIEQREGRIIRQGNKIYGPVIDDDGKILDPGPGVKIYTYVTERSFDGYMWQAVEAKSRAIKAIMRRDAPPRNIEDIDSFTMSAGEAKAIASGNPDVLRSVQLRNDVTKLQLLQASHMDAQVRAKQQLQNIPGMIKSYQGNVAQLSKDVSETKPLQEGKYSIQVKGTDYTDREKAVAALTDAIRLTKDGGIIADYRGFKFKVRDNGASYEVQTIGPSGRSYGTQVIGHTEISPEIVSDLLRKRATNISGLSKDLEKAQRDLQQEENNLKTYQKQAESPFEQQERLSAMEIELARLERKLQGLKVEEEEPLPDAVPEIQDKIEETVDATESKDTPAPSIAPSYIKAAEMKREPYQMTPKEFAKSFYSPLHTEAEIDAATNPDYVNSIAREVASMDLPDSVVASARKEAELKREKVIETLNKTRRVFVEQALKEDKVVPLNILDDFPGLKEEVQAAAREAYQAKLKAAEVAKQPEPEPPKESDTERRAREEAETLKQVAEMKEAKRLIDEKAEQEREEEAQRRREREERQAPKIEVIPVAEPGNKEFERKVEAVKEQIEQMAKPEPPEIKEIKEFEDSKRPERPTFETKQDIYPAKEEVKPAEITKVAEALKEKADEVEKKAEALPEPKRKVVKRAVRKARKVAAETGKEPAPVAKRPATVRRPIVLKAPKHTLHELQAVNANRSPIAKGLDNSQAHNLTVNHKDPRVKRWLRDPGLADILKVDTPRLHSPKVNAARRPPSQTAPRHRSKPSSPSVRVNKQYYTPMSGSVAVPRRPLKRGRR